MEEFHTGVRTTTTFYDQLNSAENQLRTIYRQFTTDVNQFKCGNPDCIVPPGQVAPVVPVVPANLARYLDDFSERIAQENNPISANEINTFTQNIFTMAFKIALIKTTFPDLDNLEAELHEIQTLKNKFGNRDPNNPHISSDNPTSIRFKIQPKFNIATSHEIPDADPVNTNNDNNYFLKYKSYRDDNSFDDSVPDIPYVPVNANQATRAAATAAATAAAATAAAATKISYEKIVKLLSKYHAITGKIKKFNKIQLVRQTFMDTLNSNLKKKSDIWVNFSVENN
jgi:hypothetical protein